MRYVPEKYVLAIGATSTMLSRLEEACRRLGVHIRSAEKFADVPGMLTGVAYPLTFFVNGDAFLPAYVNTFAAALKQQQDPPTPVLICTGNRGAYQRSGHVEVINLRTQADGMTRVLRRLLPDAKLQVGYILVVAEQPRAGSLADAIMHAQSYSVVVQITKQDALAYVRDHMQSEGKPLVLVIAHEIYGASGDIGVRRPMQANTEWLVRNTSLRGVPVLLLSPLAHNFLSDHVQHVMTHTALSDDVAAEVVRILSV